MEKDNLVGFDEAFEDLLRILPYSLYSYFKKLMEEGFNKDQALTLVRDYQKYTLFSTREIEDEEEE